MGDVLTKSANYDIGSDLYDCTETRAVFEGVACWGHFLADCALQAFLPNQVIRTLSVCTE